MSRTESIAAVFLDAGGTLLTEISTRHEIYREVALEHGLDVSIESMRASMRTVHATLPREIGPHFRYSEGWFEVFIEQVFTEQLHLPREQLGRVRRHLFERFADPRTFRLFPGAIELVRGLRRRGVRVGVVSNWSERLPTILEGLGLARELDFQVISALARAEKPERAIFELALSRSGVPARRTVHCGDDLDSDVRGAAALGILPVLLDRRGVHPDATCARVADLPEFERWITPRTTD